MNPEKGSDIVITFYPKQFMRKLTRARTDKTNKVVSAVEVYATFHTASASWRVVRDSKGRIWVENVFYLEYQSWCRFTTWGEFENPEAAVTACHLCELAYNSDAAQRALTELLRDNRGFLGL